MSSGEEDNRAARALDSYYAENENAEDSYCEQLFHDSRSGSGTDEDNTHLRRTRGSGKSDKLSSVSESSSDSDSTSIGMDEGEETEKSPSMAQNRGESAESPVAPDITEPSAPEISHEISVAAEKSASSPADDEDPKAQKKQDAGKGERLRKIFAYSYYVDF